MENEISKIDRVFTVFGGVNGMARALGKPKTTVRYWKDTQRFPQKVWASIIEAGNERGAVITIVDLFEGGTA